MRAISSSRSRVSTIRGIIGWKTKKSGQYHPPFQPRTWPMQQLQPRPTRPPSGCRRRPQRSAAPPRPAPAPRTTWHGYGTSIVTVVVGYGICRLGQFLGVQLLFIFGYDRDRDFGSLVTVLLLAAVCTSWRFFEYGSPLGHLIY